MGSNGDSSSPWPDAPNANPPFEQEEMFDEEEITSLEPYHPKDFSHRHRLICVLSAACGLKNVEIAEALGLSQGRVSVILNDPRAEKYLEQAARAAMDGLTDVGARLQFLSHEAVDELEWELRESKDERVRQRAAFGVLDRAGYGKKRTVRHEAGNLDESQVSELSDALQREPEIIEAEYEFEDPSEDDAPEGGVE